MFRQQTEMKISPQHTDVYDQINTFNPKFLDKSYVNTINVERYKRVQSSHQQSVSIFIKKNKKVRTNYSTWD